MGNPLSKCPGRSGKYVINPKPTKAELLSYKSKPEAQTKAKAMEDLMNLPSDSKSGEGGLKGGSAIALGLTGALALMAVARSVLGDVFRFPYSAAPARIHQGETTQNEQNERKEQKD